MEMPDYKKATAIDKITDWIEVSDGGIYSNFMEVNDFLQKMKTPGLKGLDEANQFRRMRDRTILTFKFEDEGKYNSYNVVAKHGNIIKKLTTSKYFFMNVPMSDKPVELTVSSIYFRLKRETFGRFFPDHYTAADIEQDILKGLELLKRQRDRSRDAR